MNYFVAITMFFHVYQDFTLIEKKVNKCKNIACVIRDYRKLSCIYREWAQCVVRLQAAMQLPLTAPHLSHRLHVFFMYAWFQVVRKAKERKRTLVKNLIYNINDHRFFYFFYLLFMKNVFVMCSLNVG